MLTPRRRLALLLALALIALMGGRLALRNDAPEVQEELGRWTGEREPSQRVAIAPAPEPAPEPEPQPTPPPEPPLRLIRPGGAYPDLEGPPGTVRVPGGKTVIGIDAEDVQAMLEESPSLRRTASLFVGETPRRVHKIDDFHLMLTEVTNEQYAVYVAAAGARPPYTWADEAIEKARTEFLEEEAARRKAAIEAGEPPPERTKFEAREWWAQNWRGRAWEIPRGMQARPVVYVDYQDARAYARWAGLRLMSEHEYQRACRGDGEGMYAWGDEWKAGKYAATQELGSRSDVMTVGSFPDGKSAQGVFDLAGNAWEWTSGKYIAHEGYEPFKLVFESGGQREEYDIPPPFNPDYRSIVGGSIQNPRLMARCTVRGGYDRFQQAGALGFRCAASPTPGADHALARANELPKELWPNSPDGPVAFDGRGVMAIDRWREATDFACQLEGYSVITGYDSVFFLPVEKLFAVQVKDLRRTAQEEGPVPIGLLGSSLAVLEPALPPGNWLVFFRSREEYGVDRDELVFVDFEGIEVASLPCEKIGSVRNQPSTLEFLKIRKIELSNVELKVTEDQSWLAFDLFLPGRITGKGFLTRLELRFDPQRLAGAWRRP